MKKKQEKSPSRNNDLYYNGTKDELRHLTSTGDGKTSLEKLNYRYKNTSELQSNLLSGSNDNINELTKKNYILVKQNNDLKDVITNHQYTIDKINEKNSLDTKVLMDEIAKLKERNTFLEEYYNNQNQNKQYSELRELIKVYRANTKTLINAFIEIFKFVYNIIASKKFKAKAFYIIKDLMMDSMSKFRNVAYDFCYETFFPDLQKILHNYQLIKSMKYSSLHSSISLDKLNTFNQKSLIKNKKEEFIPGGVNGLNDLRLYNNADILKKSKNGSVKKFDKMLKYSEVIKNQGIDIDPYANEFLAQTARAIEGNKIRRNDEINKMYDSTNTMTLDKKEKDNYYFINSMYVKPLENFPVQNMNNNYKPNSISSNELFYNEKEPIMNNTDRVHYSNLERIYYENSIKNSNNQPIISKPKRRFSDEFKNKNSRSQSPNIVIKHNDRKENFDDIQYNNYENKNTNNVEKNNYKNDLNPNNNAHVQVLVPRTTNMKDNNFIDFSNNNFERENPKVKEKLSEKRIKQKNASMDYNIGNKYNLNFNDLYQSPDRKMFDNINKYDKNRSRSNSNQNSSSSKSEKRIENPVRHVKGKMHNQKNNGIYNDDIRVNYKSDPKFYEPMNNNYPDLKVPVIKEKFSFQNENERETPSIKGNDLNGEKFKILHNNNDIKLYDDNKDDNMSIKLTKETNVKDIFITENTNVNFDGNKDLMFKDLSTSRLKYNFNAMKNNNERKKFEGESNLNYENKEHKKKLKLNLQEIIKDDNYNDMNVKRNKINNTNKDYGRDNYQKNHQINREAKKELEPIKSENNYDRNRNNYLSLDLNVNSHDLRNKEYTYDRNNDYMMNKDNVNNDVRVSKPVRSKDKNKSNQQSRSQSSSERNSRYSERDKISMRDDNRNNIGNLGMNKYNLNFHYNDDKIVKE